MIGDLKKIIRRGIRKATPMIKAGRLKMNLLIPNMASFRSVSSVRTSSIVKIIVHKI